MLLKNKFVLIKILTIKFNIDFFPTSNYSLYFWNQIGVNQGFHSEPGTEQILKPIVRMILPAWFGHQVKLGLLRTKIQCEKLSPLVKNSCLLANKVSRHNVKSCLLLKKEKKHLATDLWSCNVQVHPKLGDCHHQ